MADSDDPNAEMFRKLDDYLSRIRADDAAFDKDPYQLGVDVHALAHDTELLMFHHAASGRELLERRLPELNLERMLDAGTVAGVLPREWAMKYPWEKIVPYAWLIDGGVVRKPSGDPAKEKIPLRSADGELSRKTFAACTAEELRLTLAWARRPQPPPVPAPAPGPSDTTTPDSAPPNPWAVRVLWIAGWSIAAGLALRPICLGPIVLSAGSSLLGIAVLWLRGDLITLFIEARGAVQSGSWPKTRILAGACAVVLAAIVLRIWTPKNPFERVTETLQSVSKALPPASAPIAPAPAPTPIPVHPESSRGVVERVPVQPEPSRAAATPIAADPVHPESSRRVGELVPVSPPPAAPPAPEPAPARVQKTVAHAPPKRVPSRPAPAPAPPPVAPPARAEAPATPAAPSGAPPGPVATPAPPPKPAAPPPQPPEDPYQDLIHILGYREPKHVPNTPEEWHQRAEEIRANPKLIKEPSLLPGTEIWANLPDGGRVRER